VRAQGLEFGGGLGGTRRRPGFEERQRRPEVFSLQTATGVFDQFPAEQSLGLVMADVEVAGVAAGAVGLTQFGPTAGGVEGAGEVRWIHEGFDQQDGMTITGLPVSTEAGQYEAQGFGGEIGDGLMGQQQEAGVADDQREPAPASLVGPANPLVARAQTARGGTKDEHPEPVAVGGGDGVVETLADRLEAAQVMVFVQKLLGAG
jgi:hypothetical protein